MNPARYIKTCLLGLAGLLLFTALLNRVVDPFWYFRDIDIKGFNAEKTQFHRFERQFKPIILKDTKPEAVIFSNSFLEIGFNPQNPALTQDGRYRAYNFGMAAATWDRLFCNVVYALENTRLKTAVIGVQPMPSVMVDCREQLKTMGTVNQTTLLLSFSSLKASYKTLTQQNRKPTQTRDGMLFYHRDKGSNIEEVFKFALSNYKAQPPDKTCQPPNGLAKVPAWSYPSTQSDMAGLRYLLQRLVDAKVQVKLVVYPYHALWMEMALACGDGLSRWQNLYEMARVVDAINQSHPGAVELWDFQGTAGFMTEKIRNNQVKNWQDFGHFNYEMGDVMLDTIFHRPQPRVDSQADEFGIMLTAQSVPERYNRFVANRHAFMEANPWFAQELTRFVDH